MNIQAAARNPSNRVSFKNILYATDFSNSSAKALPLALSIAGKYGSTLFAVHVVSSSAFQISPPTIALQAIAGQALREAKVSMTGLKHQLEGIPHEIIVRQGDIWDELSLVRKDNGIDLIVVGTHGRTGASKALMGSVAEKIFRHATCPVLTVGPNVSGEPRSMTDIHAILYPTDFSSESLAAASYAISLAQENNARLYLLHVAPGLETKFDQNLLSSRLLRLVPPETNLCCAPKAFVEIGDAGQKIIDLSEELAVDLIVLGTKNVAPLIGVVAHLASTTAYRVASQALCPVLTLRG